MTKESPKLFISYSWSSPEHEQWVLQLATELRENGVDVILDKWDLREGHDAYAFMERMVSDSQIRKVVLVCDEMYARKADGRSGGVGTEAQIITPEIYAKQDQDKFVAVVAQKDENNKPYVPIYYKSRIYIDLSDPDRYATSFEQLLRWVYGKPVYVKPELGKEPAYLSETTAINLGTTTSARRALDAIKLGKEHTGGTLSEYFDTFVANLERFQLKRGEGEFDDQVIESIEKLLPYRNEALEILRALAQYRNTPDSYKRIHRFFEEIASYMFTSGRLHRTNTHDLDNFRFFVHELFLYVIASLVKYECFEALGYLLRQRYFVEQTDEISKLLPFRMIYQRVVSLEQRNNRLKLGRISVRADLLKQRTQASGIQFEQLLQADFILFIRSGFDYRRSRSAMWTPETLVYADGRAYPFEVFERAQSQEYFNRFKIIFDVESREEFEQLVQLYRDEPRLVPWWNGYSIASELLMRFDKLATTP